MTQTATLTECRVDSIQIAGGEMFDGSRWREAIIAYLYGIWAGNEVVTHRPKINFDYTTLRLDREKYVGYYSVFANASNRPRVADKDVLVVPDTQAEVENGLIRFVKNNQIRQLAIVFSGKGALVLTKGGRKRSELFLTTEEGFQSRRQYERDHGF